MPEVKPMIESLQEKLRRGKRKHSKSTKACICIRWEIES